MQSGTTSININRIYNPIKQGKDHDPKCIFIKKWVPEIKNYPDNFIHEPWLMEKFNKEEYSKSAYIKPIVDILLTTKIARRKIQEIKYREGYLDISKQIYMKHGSRKKLAIKRAHNHKKNNLKVKELQHELKLDL